MDEGERRLLHGYAGAGGCLSSVEKSRSLLLSSSHGSVSTYSST
jgi:hypothetical protein